MQQSGKVTIEKLFGGWGATFGLQSNFAPIETEPDQYSYSRSVSMNRLGFEGHIAPGFSFTNVSDATGSITALPLNGVVDSTGLAFAVLENGRIVKWQLGAGITEAHTASGATTSTNGDIINYPYQTNTSPANTTDEYIFWTWEKSTAPAQGDMGKRVKSTGAYTDNYLTGLAVQTNGTALVYGVPHPLLMGQDNNVYIGNGRYVASHDPTTTTVNYNALDLKPGWTISSLSNYQNYIAVLAYKSSAYSVGNAKSESKVFFWDGFSPSWNFEYYVKDNFASNLLYDGYDLYVISYGRNATVKLKKFNGSGFDTVIERQDLNINSAPTSPLTGGSDFWLNHIAWGTSPASGSGIGYGFINAYGSPNEKINKGLHSIAQTTIQSSRTGMVKNLDQNFLYTGYYNGASNSYFIGKSDINGFDNNNSKFFSQLYQLPTNSNIKAVKLYFSQFGTGASISVALMKDYTTISNFGDTNDLLNTTIDTTTNASSLYVPIVKTIDNVNSFYIGLQWNHPNTTSVAAIVRKIEVEYDYDDTNI